MIVLPAMSRAPGRLVARDHGCARTSPRRLDPDRRTDGPPALCGERSHATSAYRRSTSSCRTVSANERQAGRAPPGVRPSRRPGVLKLCSEASRCRYPLRGVPGFVRRPSFVSALVMKAAAHTAVGDAARGRHRSDFATLGALVAARDFRGEDLSRTDRRGLRNMIAAPAPTLTSWSRWTTHRNPWHVLSAPPDCCRRVGVAHLLDGVGGRRCGARHVVPAATTCPAGTLDLAQHRGAGGYPGAGLDMDGGVVAGGLAAIGRMIGERHGVRGGSCRRCARCYGCGCGARGSGPRSGWQGWTVRRAAGRRALR